MTRGKIGLRINLAAEWHFTDVILAYSKLKQPAGYVYRELQYGLREAIGTRTLDELLENKKIIDDIVTEYIHQKLEAFGIEVTSLGVKDIILPGEMKTLLAKVIEAEKTAQANVIR